MQASLQKTHKYALENFGVKKHHSTVTLTKLRAVLLLRVIYKAYYCYYYEIPIVKLFAKTR